MFFATSLHERASCPLQEEDIFFPLVRTKAPDFPKVLEEQHDAMTSYLKQIGASIFLTRVSDHFLPTCAASSPAETAGSELASFSAPEQRKSALQALQQVWPKVGLGTAGDACDAICHLSV